MNSFMCATEELMSLYKIRESTVTVGGSFTSDSGKIFTLLSTSPAVNN